MASNKQLKNISLIITTLVIFIAFVVGYFLFTTLAISNTKQNSSSSSNAVKINEQLFNKISAEENTAKTISINTDPNYGRNNPFDPYK